MVMMMIVVVVVGKAHGRVQRHRVDAVPIPGSNPRERQLSQLGGKALQPVVQDLDPRAEPVFLPCLVATSSGNSGSVGFFLFA